MLGLNTFHLGEIDSLPDDDNQNVSIFKFPSGLHLLEINYIRTDFIVNDVCEDLLTLFLDSIVYIISVDLKHIMPAVNIRESTVGRSYPTVEIFLNTKYTDKDIISDDFMDDVTKISVYVYNNDTEEENQYKTKRTKFNSFTKSRIWSLCYAIYNYNYIKEHLESRTCDGKIIIPFNHEEKQIAILRELLASVTVNRQLSKIYPNTVWSLHIDPSHSMYSDIHCTNGEEGIMINNSSSGWYYTSCASVMNMITSKYAN